MDVVAGASAACPLLLPVSGVRSERDCSLWNCGVLNMPAFFCELCLLDGLTTSLVASSSTAVLGARALTCNTINGFLIVLTSTGFCWWRCICM